MQLLYKVCILFLIAAMLLCLTACSGRTDTASIATEATQAPTTATEASVPADTESTVGKALVVYYSASGNTRRVAEVIAQAAGADLFEIVPTEVYTSDDLNWRNQGSRVSREHDDESLRDVPLTTTEVPDWDSYEVVFIGYRSWWGIAAWPVNKFVKANDFSKKNGYPLRNLLFLRHGAERLSAGRDGWHRQLAKRPAFLLRRIRVHRAAVGLRSWPVIKG